MKLLILIHMLLNEIYEFGCSHIRICAHNINIYYVWWNDYHEKLEPGKLYGQHLAHVFRFFIPFLQVIIIRIISLCLLLVHGHLA
jgi:hypothetical protein